MTYTEEQELLQLTRENNQLLKIILQFVHRDDGNDFMTNIIANLIANRMEGNTYEQRQRGIS